MIPLVLATSLLLVAHMTGADPVLKGTHDIDQIRAGRHVQGPRLQKGSLEGRVVLFVQWGVTGTFQDLSLPLLQLAREFGPDGFQMILSLDHPKPDNALLQKMGLTKAAWIKRRVTVTSRGRIAGKNVSGSLPFFALFDHEGRLIEVYSGGTSVTAELRKINRAILSNVDRIPPIYLGATPFVEAKELAKSISEGKDLGENLRELEKQIRLESLKTGGRSLLYGELKRILKSVRRHVDTQILVAWDLRAAEPDRGMKRLRKLETDLRGTRMHTVVEKALTDASLDQIFLQGLRYLRALDLIQMRLKRLRPCKWAAEIPNVKLRYFDPACPDCRRGKGGHIRQLEDDLARLQQTYKKQEIRWRAMSLESSFLAGRKHPMSHRQRLELIKEEKDRALAEQQQRNVRLKRSGRFGASPPKNR